MADQEKARERKRRYRRRKRIERYGVQGADVDHRGRQERRSRGRDHYRANQLGASLTSDGYVKVKVGTEHPLADANGWCYLHDLIATAALLRRLTPDEIVHHEDEDRANNDWSNLTVETRAEHNRRHNADRERGPDGRFLPRDEYPA